MLPAPARRRRPDDRDPLERAAGAWGAARTWALAERRQADVAACLALHAARGRQVVVQRDVHPATLAGLVVSGLAPHWLAPDSDPAAGVAHGVTPVALDAALSAAPGARAAIVVSPGFHGAVPDVALLAAVAHGHGAALVVDETWGGHLPFHRDLPDGAVTQGAALVLTRLGRATLPHQGRHAERWLPAATIERAVRLCAPGDADPAPLPAEPRARRDAARGRRRPRAARRAARRARDWAIPRTRRRGRVDPLRLLRRPAGDGPRRPRRRRGAARAAPRSSLRSRPSVISSSRSTPTTASWASPSASPRRCPRRSGPSPRPPHAPPWSRPPSRDRRCARRAPRGWARRSGCRRKGRSAGSRRRR